MFLFWAFILFMSTFLRSKKCVNQIMSFTTLFDYAQITHNSAAAAAVVRTVKGALIFKKPGKEIG